MRAAAEAVRRPRPSRGRPVGPLGELRHAPARDRSRPSGSRSSAVLVFYGVQLNPSEAQAKDFPGNGDAIDGRDALADAGISPGVMKPFVVLVENGARREADRRRSCARRAGRRRRPSPRPTGARADDSLVEAFPATDGAAKASRGRRSSASERSSKGTERHARRRRGRGPRLRRSAVYSNFPYVLALRRAADVHPAGARVPLARAAAEGRRS